MLVFQRANRGCHRLMKKSKLCYEAVLVFDQESEKIKNAQCHNVKTRCSPTSHPRVTFDITLLIIFSLR